MIAAAVLRLQRFFGAEGAPIMVVNCGGVVSIRNEDRAYALVIEGESHHVWITGAGAEGITYGIRASAPDREPYGGVGLWILGRSTDIAVDHVEVYETGFAGVMAKTDPGCDDRPFWDDYVMRNVRFEDMWVHDTGGEGFYVGSTQTAGYMRSCPDGDVVIPAHFLEGVSIRRTLVEDTEWDGAQIGFARSGCFFSDNEVRRVGSAGVEFQQQVLQLGAYSACDVRRNVLTDGPANGIIVLDAADTLIADNVIARVGANGVYANLRDLVDAATWRFVHNTVADFGAEDAIVVFGEGVTEERVNNLIVTDHAAAGVTEDFHLLEDSPARGAGVDLTSDGFATDLDGVPRAHPPSLGAYEYAQPIDEDPPDAGPAADGGDASGCGCTAGARGAATPGALLLLVTAGWLRRRRARAPGTRAPRRTRGPA